MINGLEVLLSLVNNPSSLPRSLLVSTSIVFYIGYSQGMLKQSLYHTTTSTDWAADLYPKAEEQCCGSPAPDSVLLFAPRQLAVLCVGQQQHRANTRLVVLDTWEKETQGVIIRLRR